MSGDLSHVQIQMVTNELIADMKTLLNCKSTNGYAEILTKILEEFSRISSTNFGENFEFTLTLIDNLQMLVPMFDENLSLNNRQDVRFEKTREFLDKIAESFDSVCLFRAFTRIGSNKRVKEIFTNFIGLIREKYLTDATNYDCLTSCLLPIVGFSSLLISVEENDIPSDFLSSLLIFTRQNFASAERTFLTKIVLSLIKIFAKKPSLVPMIIESGWSEACVEWLNLNKAEKRPSFEIDYHIYLIIQKLSRHNAGVKKLNEIDCLKKLEECGETMKRDHSPSDFECLNFLANMIYSLLVESDQIKQCSLIEKRQFEKTLDEVIRHTIEASRTEFFSYRCFHLSEMLCVLSKLFVNDDVLLKSLETNRSLFECFCQLLTHFAGLKLDPNRTTQPFDEEILLNLTNLIWSISFHEIYQEKLRRNTMLVHTITNLSSSSSLYASIENRSIPKDLCSLKKAAEGILWNLKSSTKETTTNDQEKRKEKPMAMISYCHSDASFCRELSERLSKEIPVWVDFKEKTEAIAHSDDLWEQIAAAMEMSTVIILIVSKEYYDSKSCRQELCYAADTLRKRIIPVYAPYSQYRANGWLGIRIAGQKYVHFGRKLFNDAVKELFTMIFNEQTEKISIRPSPNVQIDSSSSNNEISSKVFSLKSWTNDDVKKWFEENRIEKNLTLLLADRFETGTALIVYARHLKYFYRNEYSRIYVKYQQTFDGKKLETFDFVAMVDAFYRFRYEFDPLATVEDKFADHPALEKLRQMEDGITWF